MCERIVIIRPPETLEKTFEVQVPTNFSFNPQYNAFIEGDSEKHLSRPWLIFHTEKPPSAWQGWGESGPSVEI